MQGAGADISVAPDSFHYVWQSVPGDGGVTAQITAPQATNSYARAGVMRRGSVDPRAPCYAGPLPPPPWRRPVRPSPCSP